MSFHVNEQAHNSRWVRGESCVKNCYITTKKKKTRTSKSFCTFSNDILKVYQNDVVVAVSSHIKALVSFVVEYSQKYSFLLFFAESDIVWKIYISCL